MFFLRINILGRSTAFLAFARQIYYFATSILRMPVQLKTRFLFKEKNRENNHRGKIVTCFVAVGPRCTTFSALSIRKGFCCSSGCSNKGEKKKKKRVPTQPVRALVILMKQGTVEFFLDSGTCFEHLHLIAIVFAMVCVPWSKVISYVLNYAVSLTKPEQGTYSTIFL